MTGDWYIRVKIVGRKKRVCATYSALKEAAKTIIAHVYGEEDLSRIVSLARDFGVSRSHLRQFGRSILAFAEVGEISKFGDPATVAQRVTEWAKEAFV